MPMKRNLLMTSLGTRVIKRNMANYIIAGDSAALEGIKTTPGKKIFYFVSQLAVNLLRSFTEVQLKLTSSCQLSNCQLPLLLLLKDGNLVPTMQVRITSLIYF
jgi:hypothetical protein